MGKLDGKNVIKNKNLDGEWHLQPKISDIVAAKKEEQPLPKKVVVVKKEEKTLSEAMKGNKNAEKPGGPI